MLTNNINNGSRAVFFQSVQNFQQGGFGSIPNQGQLQSQMQGLFTGSSFSTGNAAGFGFSAQFGNFNRSGFFAPPTNIPGAMPQMPGILNQGQQGLQNLMKGFGQLKQQVTQMVKQFATQMFQRLKGMFGLLQKMMGNSKGIQNAIRNGGRPGKAVGPQAQQPALLDPQDRKVADLIKKKSGKSWLTNHGSYKRQGKNYTFTKGTLAGYKAMFKGKGQFQIINKEGEEVGMYKAPKNASKVASPVAFDLNGDGKIGTTGETTAKDRNMGTKLGRTVQFDIDGDGKKDTIEWMNGKGDGLLVDNSDGRAATDMSGKRLFGDEGGKYANGYDKLALRDKDGDGKLTGKELDGLEMWVDNGDAKVGQGELKSLKELGINEINVRKNDVKNARGETLMQSSAKTADGRQMLTEDVWFGKQ